MAWPKLLIETASVFIALPFFTAVFRYRKMGAAMKATALYVFLGAAIQVYSSWLSSKGYNNLWLLHIYTPLEFTCIVLFFSRVLEGFWPPRVFWWTAATFLGLSAVNSTFLQDVNTFNTYARSLEGVLVIAFCLIWCYRTLLEMKIVHLEDDPVFWTNTGLLLYFSGNVLLFAFSNYIVHINRALNLYIWAFHALFSILLYGLITIGLWKAK